MITFLLALADHNDWASAPWWAYLVAVVIDACTTIAAAAKL